MAMSQENNKIHKLLESLVKNQLGDILSDADQHRRVQQAIRKINRHRYLTVSKFDARQSVDNMVERLRLEWMPEQADAVRQWSDIIMNTIPAEGDHNVNEEKQYQIVDFLLSLAYSPIQNIRANRCQMNRLVQQINGEIRAATVPVVDTTKQTINENANGLDVNRISHYYDSSSSFTDSDDSSESEKKDLKSEQNAIVVIHIDQPKVEPSYPSESKPNFNVFTEYTAGDCSAIENDFTVYPNDINGIETVAGGAQNNFAITYADYVRVSELPAIHSEELLVREILMMFFMPADCCFFQLKAKSGDGMEVSMRHNSAIPNVTWETLVSFVEMEIVPGIEAIERLRKCIRQLSPFRNIILQDSRTLHSFGSALRHVTDTFKERLLTFERNFNEGSTEDGDEMTFTYCGESFRKSLMGFWMFISKDLKRLLWLDKLVIDSIIEGSTHLRTVYLLSSLYRHLADQEMEQKLAIAILLVTLKPYCEMFDKWWQWADSKLLGISEENLVKILPSTQFNFQSNVVERLKDAKANDDADLIGKVQSCPFYQMMLGYIIEVAEPHQLLENFDLAQNFLSTDDIYLLTTPFYDAVIQLIFTDNESTDITTDRIVPTQQNSLPWLQSSSSESCDDSPTVTGDDFKDLLDKLERNTENISWLMVPTAMNTIFLTRVNRANVIAMRYYHDDVKIINHIESLHQVLFLKADYKLSAFYTALFRRIENTDQNSLKAQFLTMELQDYLCTIDPPVLGHFTFRITSNLYAKSNKVFEALDGLQLHYRTHSAVHTIISDDHLLQCSDIFRMMLKIKWADWKLTNFRLFKHPHQKMYSPLDIMGFAVRRLEIVRFWMMSLIKIIHLHFSTIVTQIFGDYFEQTLKKATSPREMREIYSRSMAQMTSYSFQGDQFKKFNQTLDKFFHLIFVLEMDWETCHYYLSESHALGTEAYCITAEHMAEESKINSAEADKKYHFLEEIHEVENTFVRCHQILGSEVSNLLYNHDCKFLGYLDEVISSSQPY